MLHHDTRLPRRLQGLRQDHIIKRTIRIIGQIRIGIALDHRKSLRDAFIDPRLREFHPAGINAAPLGQQPQQRAVAAADIQHTRSGLDHLGHLQQINTRRTLSVG